MLPLPDHVSDLAGSFVEPLGCVLRGIEGLRATPLVAGAGSIGLLAAQALRARGAARARAGARARAARGAQPSSASSRPRTGERFAGALLSAAAAFPDALPLLEPGGQLVLFSGGGRSRSTSSSSTAASSWCAACARRRRATCARRWR